MNFNFEDQRSFFKKREDCYGSSPGKNADTRKEIKKKIVCNFSKSSNVYREYKNPISL